MLPKRLHMMNWLKMFMLLILVNLLTKQVMILRSKILKIKKTSVTNLTTTAVDAAVEITKISQENQIMMQKLEIEQKRFTTSDYN